MSCIGCGQIFSVRKYVLAGLSPNFLIQPIQPNYSPKFYAANTAKITIGCTAQKANTTNTVNTANALFAHLWRQIGQNNRLSAAFPFSFPEKGEGER